MSHIDWSKAPEGATHFDPVDQNWLRQFNEIALGWLADKGWSLKGWQYPHDLSIMPRLIARPVWTGEGLPPVGTVCEVQDWVNGNTPSWRKTKVIAHHLGFAIETSSADGDDVEVMVCAAGDFRPIRTPEQIAAEERKKSAVALYEAVMNFGNIGFDRLPLDRQEHYLKLVDEGWQQVKP